MTSLETIIDNLLTSKKLPYPDSVYIEPVSNLCQLKCPICPVGANLLSQDPIIMPLGTFKTILDKMPFLKTIELYRAGEPFLNPNLLAMINHAYRLNIKVIISTHFSFSKSDDFFADLVASGLDTLVVSLDGTSQESYSRYRVGGDHGLVMSNIKYLLEAKKKARSKKPKIIWQFLVNKYNEHEIETAKRISDSLKIIIDIRPIGLFDNEPDVKHGTSLEESKKKWLPQNNAYISDFYKGEWRYPLYKEICPSLFTRVVVMADGRIVPCCEIWDKENAFGNLLTQSFDEIWYGQTYIDARSRALNVNFNPQIKSVCFGCNRFETRPSLIDKLRLVQFVFRKPLRKWWQQCWS